MTHRRIISQASLQQQDATISVARVEERAFNEVSLYYIIPPVVFVYLGTNKNVIDDNQTGSFIFVLAIAAVVVFTLVIMFSLRKTHSNEKQAIALYPLGIQLGTIPVGTTIINNHTVPNVKFIPHGFLHRETIVDCVVTELVYSYKVQSVVILRIKQPNDEYIDATPSSRQHDVATNDERDNRTDILTRTRKARERVTDLIRLFSDTEMTYMKCLNIRSQINNYLNQNVETIYDAQRSRS